MRISWWDLKFSVDFPQSVGFLSPQILCLLITMSVSIHGRKKGNGQPVSSVLFIRGAKFSSNYPDWTSSYIFSGHNWHHTVTPNCEGGEIWSKVCVCVCVCVLVAQSCLILWDPVDCSPLGSSVHGILQARVLKWVAILSSRGYSQPRDWTWVSSITGKFFSV